MIAIVLIQESKGGGLSTGFAGGNAVLGVRKTTDFIEKATWTLAGAMVVLSVICAYVAPTAATDASVIDNAATNNSSTNPNTLPNFGASQQKQAAPAANGDAKQAAPAANGAAAQGDAKAE